MSAREKILTNIMNDCHEGYYKGPKAVYFYRILNSIIRIGNLHKRNVKILDFGCGVNKLKRLLGDKVTGYDVIPYLSEVKYWKKVKFDVVVANEVLYLLSPQEIREFILDIQKINPNAELIVGISKHRILNKIAAFISGEREAHKGAKTHSKNQMKILKEKMNVIKKKTVFFMCDIFLLKFRNTSRT